MTTPELDDAALEFASKVFAAAREGDADVLKQWLDQGLPVNLRNHNGDTLLMLASYHEHPKATQVLLERGADAQILNERGQSPLSGAAFKGNVEITQLLLSHGAQVDVHGEDGRTPLMFAAMFNRTDIMEILLREGGANILNKDAAGNDTIACAKALNAQESLAWLELYLAGDDKDFFELS